MQFFLFLFRICRGELNSDADLQAKVCARSDNNTETMALKFKIEFQVHPYL